MFLLPCYYTKGLVACDQNIMNNICSIMKDLNK